MKTRWQLQDYFYSGLKDPKFTKDWSLLEASADKLTKRYKGKLVKLKPKEWLVFLEFQNKLGLPGARIGQYLSLSSSLDSQNQILLKKIGELHLLGAQLSNKTLWIDEELKKLGSKKLRLLGKKLPKYQNFFNQTAKSLKFLLPEPIEEVLNLTEQSGVVAFQRLYKELTSSFKFDVNGEMLTDAEARTLRTSPDPKIRKAAHKAFAKVYTEDKIQITLGSVYKSIVRDWVTSVDMRKYSQVMSPHNIYEELDDETVDLLLKEVKASFPLYQRYLKWKAKKMKMKKINSYDLFAPFSSKMKEVPFKETYKLVIKAFDSFSKKFGDYAKDMFTGRVDVYPKHGKSGGAFASYQKGFESFVMLNYTGEFEDMHVVAHELGHAIHGSLSQKQPPQLFHSPLSLAETASVFSEMLFAEHLLPTLKKQDKLAFKTKFIETAFATIQRQVQYVLFEREVHSIMQKGHELTYKDFNILWRRHQENLFGDIVEFDLPSEQDYGWSAIPHIHMVPFYCYAYAFGNLLTFALFKKVKENPKFVKHYTEILESGGSKPPYELLKEHGIDIKKPEFYRAGLDELKRLVEELERSF